MAALHKISRFFIFTNIVLKVGLLFNVVRDVVVKCKWEYVVL
jgi:hypothetical protein